jgi:hypothetical protein
MMSFSTAHRSKRSNALGRCHEIPAAPSQTRLREPMAFAVPESLIIPPSHYTQLSCRRHCRVCSDCVDPETRPSTSILTTWRRYATTSAQRRQQQARSNNNRNNTWTFIESRRILLSWIPQQQYCRAGQQEKERYKPRYQESQAPNGRRPARAAAAFAP